MSSFKEHCEESERLYGQPFPKVHLWLDEFAGKPPFGMRHRHLRHHQAGVEEAMKRFGPKAGPVARQHIISDLKMEGWTEADAFPRDGAHYKRLGLF